MSCSHGLLRRQFLTRGQQAARPHRGGTLREPLRFVSTPRGCNKFPSNILGLRVNFENVNPPSDFYILMHDSNFGFHSIFDTLSSNIRTAQTFGTLSSCCP
jgi:hypothetical protein